LPPVIRCDEVGSYPWQVLSQRHPALIAQTRAAFPYPPLIDSALDALLREILDEPMTALPGDEHDAADWAAAGAECFGRSWFDAPFLFAESYFYRRLLHAVDFFHDGPWQGVDPFGPVKRHELASAQVDTDLADMGRLAAAPPAARLDALTRASLWGNLADLGFLMSSPGGVAAGRSDELIADDSQQIWDFVRAHAPLRLGFVTDNAAVELVHDLALVDHLLAEGLASGVTLHVKRYPYFVSDATSEDVVDCLIRLRNGPPAAQAAADRLFRAYGEGGLQVSDSGVFMAPVSYHELDVAHPGSLARAFAGDDLVLAKGDLNYRRLAGDRHWHGDEPFASVLSYFPAPVAALRTVKSEVAIGLTAATMDALAARDPLWRGNGRHAMIQARLGRPYSQRSHNRFEPPPL
jgi:uncharacterized protein with ATP-grasp and redox domains